MRTSDFVLDMLERRGLTAIDFERLTGDRFRNVKQGRQKPPLASLHRWAKALDLNESDTITLLLLADADHGGGSIARWFAEEIHRRQAQIAALEQVVDQQALRIAQVEHKTSVAKPTKRRS